MTLSIVPSPAASVASPSTPSSVMEPPQWFQGRGIPPERVGLNGEYDHAGLTKRVIAALQQEGESFRMEGLRVSQRGRVVILSGQVESQEVLQQMVARSLQVEGAAFVETNGIRLIPDRRTLGAA